MIDEIEKKLNLNGDWFFIKDISGNLNIDDIKNSLSKNTKAETMTIPTNWELAGLHNYNGSVWFIREFNPNFSLDNLAILTFLGVDYFAEVWLNWNYLGRHEGYFSPFSFNLSSSIKSNNILIVKVTSPFEIPG